MNVTFAAAPARRYPWRMAVPTPAPGTTTAGRTAGFIFAVIAALVFWWPLPAFIFGIIAVVQSLRALRRTPRGELGRGLIVASLVIAIAAMVVAAMLAISALLTNAAG
jgi:hypothetical protein